MWIALIVVTVVGCMQRPKHAVIFYASKNLPEDQIEAAQIDGAKSDCTKALKFTLNHV